MKYLKCWALITCFSSLSVLKYCRADFWDASWQPNLKKQQTKEVYKRAYNFSPCCISWSLPPSHEQSQRTQCSERANSEPRQNSCGTVVLISFFNPIFVIRCCAFRLQNKFIWGFSEYIHILQLDKQLKKAFL